MQFDVKRRQVIDLSVTLDEGDAATVASQILGAWKSYDSPDSVTNTFVNGVALSLRPLEAEKIAPPAPPT